MNTNDLQPWQIEKMMEPIQHSLRYLSTLLDRMNDVVDDLLFNVALDWMKLSQRDGAVALWSSVFVQ